MGVFRESIGSGIGRPFARGSGLFSGNYFVVSGLVDRICDFVRSHAGARDDSFGAAPLRRELSTAPIDFVNRFWPAVARTREYHVRDARTAPTSARVRPDAEILCQSDRAFTQRTNIRKDRVRILSGSLTEHQNDISQARSRPLGQIAWQRNVRNLRGIHEPRRIVMPFRAVEESGAGYVIPRERIIRALHEGIAVFVLNDSVPPPGLARIEQIIEARIVRVVSVRRAVGVDRKSGAEEESRSAAQLPDRSLPPEFAKTINVKVEPARTRRTSVP